MRIMTGILGAMAVVAFAASPAQAQYMEKAAIDAWLRMLVPASIMFQVRVAIPLLSTS